jgi:predicted lipoprotein with Yx(FWY)xxD motif
MTFRRPITLFGGTAALTLSAVAVVACGGTSASNSSPSSSPPASSSTPGGNGGGAAPPSASGPATVSTASNGNLGTILVDSQGRTLYLFQADKGTTSACSGSCASAWPPLTPANGTATAGGGANASLVGTTMRSDGTQQVTYNGHPLYLYIGDTKAGTASGQGINAFGALWYVVSPQGNQLTGGSSSSSSGLGY